LVPISSEQWPFLADGAGPNLLKINNLPEVVGLDQAMISRSSTYTSLKKSFPFQPPKTNSFVPPRD
jgi:hypothetical protein